MRLSLKTKLTLAFSLLVLAAWRWSRACISGA